ncbi:MAG: DHHW family protein [Christensenellales bacterium]|jgi:hypothetical protein
MSDSFNNKTITLCFGVILIGFMAANILVPDTAVSFSERRFLSGIPSFDSEELLSGELFEKYEKYFLDQFVLRENLRGLKAFFSLRVFSQKDNNGIYIVDGNIHKIEYPLREAAIKNAADKLNEVYEKYLQGMNASFAIIPDKNYFAAEKNGYLSLDYERLIALMRQHVRNIGYIDLFHAVDIDDYYRTDLHWSQERIPHLADLLLRELGNEAHSRNVSYTEKTLYPYYGSYYGQAALKLEPDTLVYLTNDMLENASVYDHIDGTVGSVYSEEKFGTIDSYDIFLSGAKSLLTIINPGASTDRELILFRDSFGSSIAPLLLKGYAKITLVDLRYLRTDMLGDYIDFHEGQDVLFLYHTMILNNSYMLK